MSEQQDKQTQAIALRKPMEFTDLVARIVKDSTLFLLVGGCVFWLMALIGYDGKDPGWSHVGYQPQISNWAGAIGALWADIAFSFLGLLAWVIPVMLIYPCVRLYRRKFISLLDSLPFVMLRVVGALLFVFTASALFSLHLSNITLNYPFTTGGIIGQVLSEWMVSWFSIHGSSVVLWFSSMIGLTLFMEQSWRELMLKLGGAILASGLFIKGVFSTAESAPSSDGQKQDANEVHESINASGQSSITTDNAKYKSPVAVAATDYGSESTAIDTHYLAENGADRKTAAAAETASSTLVARIKSKFSTEQQPTAVSNKVAEAVPDEKKVLPVDLHPGDAQISAH